MNDEELRANLDAMERRLIGTLDELEASVLEGLRSLRAEILTDVHTMRAELLQLAAQQRTAAQVNSGDLRKVPRKPPTTMQ